MCRTCRIIIGKKERERGIALFATEAVAIHHIQSYIKQITQYV
jgi:hypothetical protein